MDWRTLLDGAGAWLALVGSVVALATAGFAASSGARHRRQEAHWRGCLDARDLSDGNREQIAGLHRAHLARAVASAITPPFAWLWVLDYLWTAFLLAAVGWYSMRGGYGEVEWVIFLVVTLVGSALGYYRSLNLCDAVARQRACYWQIQADFLTGVVHDSHSIEHLARTSVENPGAKRRVAAALTTAAPVIAGLAAFRVFTASPTSVPGAVLLAVLSTGAVLAVIFWPVIPPRSEPHALGPLRNR